MTSACFSWDVGPKNPTSNYFSQVVSPIFFNFQHKLIHVNEELKTSLDRLTMKVQQVSDILDGKKTTDDSG